MKHFATITLAFTLSALAAVAAPAGGSDSFRKNGSQSHTGAPVKPDYRPAPTPAPAPAPAGNARRTVLTTLGRNEIIWFNEYRKSLKGSGNRFFAIVNDTVTSVMTLIRDGERVVSAPEIYVPFYNPERPDDLVFVNVEGRDSYISICGRRYGPYQAVNTSRYDAMQGRSLGEFYFMQMDRWFRQDPSGAVYPAEPYDSRAKGDQTYSCAGGRHTLRFADDGRTAIVDGSRVTLFAPGADEYFIARSVMLDDGRAVVEGYSRDSANGKSWKGFLLKGGSTLVSYDPLTNVVDLSTGKLKPINDFDTFDGDPYSPFTLETRFDCYWNGNVPHMKNEFVVQDPSHRHTLMADWRYDYVMVDGQRYGQACPVEAHFDERAREFVWTALEGRELVMYRLPV